MLDPQSQALLDLMVERKVPPVHTLSATEARRLYLERRTLSQPEPPPMAEVSDLRCPGPAGEIALRLFCPLGAAQPAPVLVYFHGGGWTLGDIDTHDVLCRQLAAESQFAVVSVDYRLGPEQRFPAAVDDCIAATRWVQAEGASLGLDATRLAVGGDSAGGNLAAVVAIALRQIAAPAPILQLLIYPATDMRATAPSHQVNGQGFLLTSESIAYYRANYIDDPRLYNDWRASPLLHPDLSKLPPALVLTAGFDPLRDEGLQYADALSAAGNAVQYLCFERQIHGFITMGRLIDEANLAIALCARALQRALPTIT